MFFFNHHSKLKWIENNSLFGEMQENCLNILGIERKKQSREEKTR